MSSTVKMGTSSAACVTGIGHIDLVLPSGHGICSIRLQNVLHEPDFWRQLSSVSKITSSGHSVAFDNLTSNINLHSRVTLKGAVRDQLCKLHLPQLFPSSRLAGLFSDTSEYAHLVHLQIWRERLRHISHSCTRDMVNRDVVSWLTLPLKNGDRSHDHPCTVCVGEQRHKSAFPLRESSRASYLFSLVHDVTGPMEIFSMSGAGYFISFIDDRSKWIKICSMRLNSESFIHFKNFHVFAENIEGSTFGFWGLITAANTFPLLS